MVSRVLNETTSRINIAAELKKFSVSQAEQPLSGKDNNSALGRKDLQALYEISQAVNSTLILDQILNKVMLKAVELLHAERGFLMLLDTDGQLIFKTAHNINKKELIKSDLQISTTIAEGVVKSGKSIYTSDAINDKRFLSKQSVLEMNIRSALCVPLKIKGQIIGVVYLDNSSKANIFLKSDLHLFEMFADQAALAIQNAQLYTDLLNLQNYQEAILDRTPAGIMVLSEDGVIQSHNTAALELLNRILPKVKLQNIESLEINFLDLLPKRERLFWQENITKSADENLEIPSRRVKTGNDDIVIRMRFSPFDHKHNNFSGRIVLLEDITERVLLEQYLVVSEKMVAKGEMAAAIGHELNNYLTTILSSAQLLSKYIEDDRYEKVPAKVTSIIEGIDRMKRFTSGLMDFSSLETSKTLCNLQAVIDDVVFFVKPQQKFRDINIEVNISPDIPDIMMDNGQIHQVILNTLVNAADSICESNCSEGKIVVTADLKDDNVRITISDNGPGISDEIMPRIFQPHITSKKKGHGLGLSNSKRIINSHNGQIRAENNPDRGAVFTFSLPLG